MCFRTDRARHARLDALCVFRAIDGDLVIAAQVDDAWKRFASLIEASGGPRGFGIDERFHHSVGRNTHRLDILGVVEPWVAARTVTQILELLDGIDEPCAKVQRIDEVIADPQIQARGMIVEQEHPRYGTLRLPNLPFRFSACDTTIREVAPIWGSTMPKSRNRWVSRPPRSMRCKPMACCSTSEATMSDTYAVIGNPIGHTKSPLIHGFFAEATQQAMHTAIEGPCEPDDAFAATVRKFIGRRRSSLRHSTWPMSAASATLAGAANAFKFDGGRILADNFDGIGLLRDIEVNLHTPFAGKRVLLLVPAAAAARCFLPGRAPRTTGGGESSCRESTSAGNAIGFVWPDNGMRLGNSSAWGASIWWSTRRPRV